MLTLQSNNEIRINRGDTGMVPFFINIGDSLRPIGYQFNLPLTISVSPESLKIDFYEDAWREHVLSAGTYEFIYNNNSWTLNGEPVEDISLYGFTFPNITIPNLTTINVVYNLISNESKAYFQMWPILQDPKTPLLEKIIYPKEQTILTYLNGDLISTVNTNTVDSYGRILLKFENDDMDNIERGKYLYQLRTYLYNAFSNTYDIKTIINRTPFYVIDDNFTERVW